jgi:hypothetical protein
VPRARQVERHIGASGIRAQARSAFQATTTGYQAEAKAT